MYKASEVMKLAFFIAMATKIGNTNEQRSNAENVSMYYFLWRCPWKRVCLYCVPGTSTKQNNQIARDIMRILLASIKNDEKNMTKP